MHVSTWCTCVIAWCACMIASMCMAYDDINVYTLITYTLTSSRWSTANPTWGAIFECCFKAQSSNVSFQWNMAKETFELWALSFRKCHPKWDWLYLYDSIYVHGIWWYQCTYIDNIYIDIFQMMYRVATTHMMPYLYMSFSVKEPYK